MLILSISHHIYLTKEQRYSLIEKQKIEAIGVSVPVWIKNDGDCTEPATEVFCKYKLRNEEKRSPIKLLKDGYSINMPQKEEEKEENKMSNKIWRSLDAKHRNEYYANKVEKPCANWLKDLADGGGRHLHFKEHNKVYQGKECLEIYHYVQIDTLDSLKESLS